MAWALLRHDSAGRPGTASCGPDSAGRGRGADSAGTRLGRGLPSQRHGVHRPRAGPEFIATYPDGTRGDRAKELANAAAFNQQIDSSTLRRVHRAGPRAHGGRVVHAPAGGSEQGQAAGNRATATWTCSCGVTAAGCASHRKVSGCPSERVDREVTDMRMCTHFARRAGGRLALAVALRGAGARRAAPASCDPAGPVKFVCGQAGPEDLVAVPDTRWLIASAFGGDGGLFLIDTRAASSTKLFPSATAAAQARQCDLRRLPGSAADLAAFPDARAVPEAGHRRPPHVATSCITAAASRWRSSSSTCAAGADDRLDGLRGGARPDRAELRAGAARGRVRGHQLPAACARGARRRRFLVGARQRREQRRAVGMAHRPRLDQGAGQRSGRRQRARVVEGRQVVLRGAVGQPVLHARVARPDAGRAGHAEPGVPRGQRAVGARRHAARRRPGRPRLRGAGPGARRRAVQRRGHVDHREGGSREVDLHDHRGLPDEPGHLRGHGRDSGGRRAVDGLVPRRSRRRDIPPGLR